jgi:hypothetical protein
MKIVLRFMEYGNHTEAVESSRIELTIVGWTQPEKGHEFSDYVQMCRPIVLIPGDTEARSAVFDPEEWKDPDRETYMIVEVVL